MDTVTVHTAKTTLSQLLARVEAGEEIVVSRGRTPIAKIVPFAPKPLQRQPGKLKGKIAIGPEFFDPLPEEELAGLE